MGARGEAVCRGCVQTAGLRVEPAGRPASPALKHTSLFYSHCPSEMPFRMTFAGESDSWSPDSVLSHCYGALLPMFTTKEATTVQGVQEHRGRLPLGGREDCDPWKCNSMEGVLSQGKVGECDGSI